VHRNLFVVAETESKSQSARPQLLHQHKLRITYVSSLGSFQDSEPTPNLLRYRLRNLLTLRLLLSRRACATQVLTCNGARINYRYKPVLTHIARPHGHFSAIHRLWVIDFRIYLKALPSSSNCHTVVMQLTLKSGYSIVKAEQKP